MLINLGMLANNFVLKLSPFCVNLFITKKLFYIGKYASQRISNCIYTMRKLILRIALSVINV